MSWIVQYNAFCDCEGCDNCAAYIVTEGTECMFTSECVLAATIKEAKQDEELSGWVYKGGEHRCPGCAGKRRHYKSLRDL